MSERCTPPDNAAKTHCKRGHAFDEHNTYRWRNSRVCKTCAASRHRNMKRHQARHPRPSVSDLFVLLIQPSTVERFWSRVQKGHDSECWAWSGGTDTCGYGALSIKRHSLRASRAAWMLANRKPVPSGLSVLHSCDNPPCCNPNHLRVGTIADNSADAVARGRVLRKLPEGEHANVVAAFLDGERPLWLAKRYGLQSAETIVKVLRRAGVYTVENKDRLRPIPNNGRRRNPDAALAPAGGTGEGER